MNIREGYEFRSVHRCIGIYSRGKGEGRRNVRGLTF